MRQTLDGVDPERMEAILTWMEKAYESGEVPTIDGLCAAFGLTPSEALAVVAEFHRRHPASLITTITAASKNPARYVGVRLALPAFRGTKKRFGPPGIPVVRKFGLRDFMVIIGFVIVLIAVILGLTGVT